MAPRLGLGGGVTANPASGLFAGIPEATNDWNFALDQEDYSELLHDSFITFTRASVGRVMDASGNIVEIASGEPRYGYDVEGNSLGLLMERASTNLMYRSDFSSDWSAYESNGLDAGNTTTGPDGVSGSGKSINTQAGAGFHLTYIYSMLSTSNIEYKDYRCYSVYAKKGNADYFRMGFTLNFSGSFTQVGASFNLDSGSVDDLTACSAEIESVGNGWYRCIIHSTSMPSSDGSTYGGVWMSPSNTSIAYESPLPVVASRDEGAADEHVFLWGMNIEERTGVVDRTFPTSFINTTGSQVTRPIDQARGDTSDWSWSDTEGSMLIELERTNTADASGSMGILVIDGAGTGEHIEFHSSTTEENFQINSSAGAGSTAVMDVGDDVAPNTPYKIAAGWKDDDVAVTLNGATSVTDTSFTLDDVFDSQEIDLGGTYFNGFIKRVRYWDTKLTNEQLEELST